MVSFSKSSQCPIKYMSRTDAQRLCVTIYEVTMFSLVTGTL